uniref:Phage integrase, N-terminal SAM-like domain n=1 Tax=Candidatus Kentrum sp. MB TaxID=2138164 RepID=A0A450X478_9GAMM|nr:MAG: hypothetical protein BECKMB1821G_GA0114241_100724 [Candidatus Kentron sp. MB]VFK30494.1 MAG: hypothetical protein BECKMB1821I_GA0114274_10166 [Candidatus Kentron sp. MB]VFK75273.1 MAG: hypothetical protein BECKMB1821H_GA0114242_10195 [Candidatus Kentron sp. MB]
MRSASEANFKQNYQTRLKLKGLQPSTIDAYARAIRRIPLVPKLQLPLVPKLQLGNLLLGNSSFPSHSISLSPFPTNLDQSRLPQIVSRAGITPVFRSIHIPSRHWIMMDVIKLLTHHRLAYDGLRVIAFFLNLIGGFGFVGA